MPILRVNAYESGIALHGSPAPVRPCLRRAAKGEGPVIIMIHGFKYDPDCAGVSPHSTIFALRQSPGRPTVPSWPRHLGFGTGYAGEGLAVAFGWRARGDLRRAQAMARIAGRHLAQLITTLRDAAPDRPMHIITHSMGSEVAFEALHHLPAHSVQRLITLTGASHRARAEAALATRAGRSLEMFNITSRENDLFDCLFEWLLPGSHPYDRALGQGVTGENVANIQIDCPQTLWRLQSFSARIAPSQRRICHWSGYTRPGALAFYAKLFRQPRDTPLAELQAVLPAPLAPRWSRLARLHPQQIQRDVLPWQREMSS